MLNNLLEFIMFYAACVAVILIGLIITITPFVYLSGKANSNWLMQTQQIEIPWYEAAFLEVQINDVDATIQ